MRCQSSFTHEENRVFAEEIQPVQVADLGVSRGYLEQYLRDSGYWANAQRCERYAYVLSPSVYVVSRRQEAQLERLAVHTYAAVEALNKKLCSLAKKPHLTKEEARFLKLAGAASRSLFRPLDGQERIPPVIKVDIMQDAQDRYQIAEVDVYNPRGFGFAAMLEESLTSRMKLRRFPGMEELTRIFVEAQGDGQLRTLTKEASCPWFVVVSEYERFYRAPYEILAAALKRRGMHIATLGAQEAFKLLRAPQEEGVMQMNAGFLSIPDTLFTEGSEVRERFLSLYREGSLKTIFPPVAYLGSKAFLPFLRTQQGMSEHIPPTTLVGGGSEEEELYEGTRSKAQVLKAAVSSGMKGVYFSDIDQPEYAQALAKARAQRNPSWVLQEQVKQYPSAITVFDAEGNRVVKPYYLRITAYISATGIVDAEVTGRPDRKVHGAPDCIQIPVVLS